MPCFQVVSYAFVGLKYRKMFFITKKCKFTINPLCHKFQNVLSGQRWNGSFESHTGRRIDSPQTKGTTSVARLPCTPRSCKGNWSVWWACSLCFLGTLPGLGMRATTASLHKGMIKVLDSKIELYMFKEQRKLIQAGGLICYSRCHPVQQQNFWFLKCLFQSCYGIR